jgi:hypothetical protein
LKTPEAKTSAVAPGFSQGEIQQVMMIKGVKKWEQ